MLWGAQGSLWVAWGTSWELVRFWTPFSEKMFQNPCVLHGLGAGEVQETGLSGLAGLSGSAGFTQNEPQHAAQTPGAPRLSSG